MTSSKLRFEGYVGAATLAGEGNPGRRVSKCTGSENGALCSAQKGGKVWDGAGWAHGMARQSPHLP